MLVVAVPTAGSCSELNADPEDDFTELGPTTTASMDGDPYDQYVQISEQLGEPSLEFLEAEQLASELCSRTPEETTSPDRLSPTELAILSAYCPELQADG